MYEYMIHDVPGREPTAALAWLNDSGVADWEAFFVEPHAEGYRLWLKRRRSGIAGGLERSQTEDLRG